MSKIIENFLVPLFLVISVLYAFHSFGLVRHSSVPADVFLAKVDSEGGADGIVLNKVYHHTAPDDGYLEKAKISLYFSGDPQVQEIKNKEMHDGSLVTFFFPPATISHGECESMIHRLNSHSDTYKVAISPAIHPTKGIMVQFDCDANKYLIKCEQFDSIGLQKGFVFQLYNKELLTKLEKAHNQPVLRTLWHSSSASSCGIPGDLSAKALHKPSASSHDGVPGVEKRSWGKRIVIDSGHGGRDTGALGHNGVQEKQVCLAIGTVVGDLLKQQGCSVLLTRKNDCEVQLDERTSYANNNNADLFVSIHANYASSPQAVGVETFCMQPSLLKKRSSQLSDEQDICVADVMKQRAHMSYNLAQSVQNSVCSTISSFHNEPIDRKVKYSVSQVLLGVHIPAILIEVGFLSHVKEARLLNDVQYQQCIARGICDGILSVFSF